MNILFLINSLSAGGAEVFVTELATHLKIAGHETGLFCFAGILDEKGKALAEQCRAHGISVHAGSRNILKDANALQNLIKAVQPDVIHSHLEQSDTLLAVSQLLWPKPQKGFAKVRTIHNEYATKRIPKIGHWLLSNYFDLTLCCSTSVEKYYPYKGNRHCVIENGLNVTQILARAETLVTQNHNSESDTVKLVNIGSFNTRNGQLQKGQDLIVEAISQIKYLNFTVDFIGDGAMLEPIKALSIQLDVADRCVFHGIQTNPERFIQLCDAFLLPSRFEGLPISCLEAMALGKPLLLSNIPSLQRFKHSSTLYCEPNNPSSLAQTIKNFIENRHTYQLAAKSDCKNRLLPYTIEKCGQMHIESYEKAIDLSKTRKDKKINQKAYS
jgi:glycosyltransferase involved in cell wall biosynthesis